jgi:hypothetical protein
MHRAPDPAEATLRIMIAASSLILVHPHTTPRALERLKDELFGTLGAGLYGSYKLADCDNEFDQPYSFDPAPGPREQAVTEFWRQACGCLKKSYRARIDGQVDVRQRAIALRQARLALRYASAALKGLHDLTANSPAGGRPLGNVGP